MLGKRKIILLILAALPLAVYGGWIYFIKSVERPAYTTHLRDGSFEIRSYPSMIVAEIAKTGERRSAVGQGFGPLASYIFAKKRDGEKIAMTAPVMQSPETENQWVVRFILPSKYALEDLPKPDNPDISLVGQQPSKMAVVRFSGVATDALIAEREAALRSWMAERELTPQSAVTYAYYDDPMTIGFLRRNEVMFRIANGPE